jgi:O-acetyl-ADP-ribose deacetylase
MTRTIGKATLELVDGDITLQQVDAIVNAANRHLAGGGGVDGAIHRAGGPAIAEACSTLGGCAPGDAKITTGGRLPANWVIHTVGPVFTGAPGDPVTLASCYRRSLEVAEANGARTVAFPSISTGAYGYPIREAAQVALSAVIEHLRDTDRIDLVRFVLFGARDHAFYCAALAELVPEH